MPEMITRLPPSCWRSCFGPGCGCAPSVFFGAAVVAVVAAAGVVAVAAVVCVAVAVGVVAGLAAVVIIVAVVGEIAVLVAAFIQL